VPYVAFCPGRGASPYLPCFFLLYIFFAGLTVGLHGAVVGASRLHMLVCWSLYLSFLQHSGMMPWDCFLQGTATACAPAVFSDVTASSIICAETGFCCLFLPFGSGADAIPNPAVCWWFRWLLFRLMYGFGSFKFNAAHPTGDALYLREFMTWQPMPARLGYWAAVLVPDWMFKVGLKFYWFAEMVVPFAFIFGVCVSRYRYQWLRRY
jgi:hypothetical protein